MSIPLTHYLENINDREVSTLLLTLRYLYPKIKSAMPIIDIDKVVEKLGLSLP